MEKGTSCPPCRDLWTAAVTVAQILLTQGGSYPESHFSHLCVGGRTGTHGLPNPRSLTPLSRGSVVAGVILTQKLFC